MLFFDWDSTSQVHLFFLYSHTVWKTGKETKQWDRNARQYWGKKHDREDRQPTEIILGEVKENDKNSEKA